MNRTFAKTMTMFLLGGALLFTSCGSSKKMSANRPKNENPSMVSELSKRKEIAVIEEDDNGFTRLELFSMDRDDGDAYYLSVGCLGYGDKFIQIYIDPFHELFIPLGTTLDEAEATLQQFKDFYKQPKGATMEIMGCFNSFIPNEKRESVTLTHTRLLLNDQIRFSIEREDELRATFVSRSDINSMLSSLKFYRKIHPKKR